MRDYLQDILSGSCVDADTGERIQVPTRRVVIESSLKKDEADLLAGLDIGESYAVVYDSNTYDALGRRVERAASSLGPAKGVLIPGTPHPDAATADWLQTASAGYDAVVAVGSGVINDLCKYVAAQTGRRCAVFATAASMNGYTSVNAAITVHGHKKSLSAMAPDGVFVDLGVLSDAPARLTQAGLGDSLCRCTAQTDWLAASHIFGSEYREFPFTILAEDEAALVEYAQGLLKKDRESMRRLARVLVLSGFGMTICGDSRPASQGEHLISHYTDMMKASGSFEDLHGRQIAVTSLTMAGLQEYMLSSDSPPQVAASSIGKREICDHFGPETGAECWSEFQKKRLSQQAAEQLNRQLIANWDTVRARLEGVRRSRDDMAAILKRIDAPTHPSEVGWERIFYIDAVRHAREIRNRYTFLDLAADSGVLEDYLTRL